MVWLSNWWELVGNTAIHGLQITVVGMSLVFMTLGLIIVSLIVLTQLPGLRGTEEKNVAQPSSPPTEEGPPASDVTTAQVAAIAVAVLRDRRRARARTAPREGGRPWRAWRNYGRANQLGL